VRCRETAQGSPQERRDTAQISLDRHRANPLHDCCIRFGTQRMFRIATVQSFPPMLFVTHLPDLPFYALVMFFPFFLVLVSGRMVPMQALLTTVPKPARRGALLSANSALQR
jgi:hypothetical protein